MSRWEFKEEEEQPSMELEVTEAFRQLPEVQQEVILTAALQYEKLNQIEKLFKLRRDKQERLIIEEACDEYGVPDPNEHKHLVGILMKEYPNGEVEEVEVEIIREKKSSRILNTVAAEVLLREKGLYSSCVVEKVSYVIDEEKIIEAYEAHKINAAELDSIFTNNPYYATKVKTNEKEIAQLRTTRLKLEKGKPINESEMPRNLNLFLVKHIS
jgi:hypothetical protein